MTDAPRRLANKTLLTEFFQKHSAVKNQTSTIAGEFGQRLQAQVENGNFHRGAFTKASAIYNKSRTNELAAREEADHLRYYLEVLDEMWKLNGHVGDLADMAKADNTPQGSQPSDALPLEEAERVFAKNADKAPTPAEVDEAAEKRAAGRKGKREKPNAHPDTSFTESLRENNAAVEADIKARANGSDDDEPDLPAPPPAPAGRKPATGKGTFRNLN